MLPSHKVDAEVRSVGTRPPMWAVAGGSAVMGAVAAMGVAVAARNWAPWAFDALAPSVPVEPLATVAVETCAKPPSTLKFSHSLAQDAMGELSADEVKSVANWFKEHHGAYGERNSSKNCRWMAGPSGVELLFPPKSEVVAYLDGKGPRPARFARVTSVGPEGVQEWSVGPIVDGKMAPNAASTPLTQLGDIPYAQRPTENNADMNVASGLINSTLRAMQPLLVANFGNIFPMFEGFDPKEGVLDVIFRNDALSPAGQRSNIMIFQWMPPPPAQPDSSWLHPLPLTLKIMSTEADPSLWNVTAVWYCGQGPFNSAADLMKAHSHGDIRMCVFHKETGKWDFPQRTTPADPAGRHPLETNAGISWGPWSFTVTSRPSTGAGLLDVRFRGERILYELAVQDAAADYSGTSQSQFFYADASWSMTMLSASLEPGVDCPKGAHFLPVTNFAHMTDTGMASIDPLQAYTFYPVCVFEWEEDHTIWRHMQNTVDLDVRGLTRKTIVVRSVSTVGNYDYITDIKLREDGEIEVKTRFAGFIEARHFDPKANPEETNFSTIVRPDLAGPVHSHLVNWKADFDIAGVRENALHVTRVKAAPLAASHKNPTNSGEQLISKYLERTYVSEEGVGKSTFVAMPMHPTTWSIVDRKATSAAGNPRGYAIALASWSTLQSLPDNHPFVKAMPLTKYHLAVTKHHDSEYRSSSAYIQYDGMEKAKNAQDLDRFLSDGENLMDEDIVAWIGVGREHIVRQEDLPLVSNFGAGFHLMPFNFFTQNVAASPPWEK